MLKKFLILLVMLTSFSFAYETVKATQITQNPEKYKNKNVLVYVKFGALNFNDNSFSDFNVENIKYVYSNELVDKIEKLKQRDLITLKGKVVLKSFNPMIEIEDFSNGWVDTTLMPATPSEILITCPKCGETFKYQITKNDYKKSVVDSRKSDITESFKKKDEVVDSSNLDITESFKKKDEVVETSKKNIVAPTSQEPEVKRNNSGWTL